MEELLEKATVEIEAAEANSVYGEWKEMTAHATMATAYAAIAQAEALLSIATHLGNIHQALLTPDANLEPTTVADQSKRIADALESLPAHASNDDPLEEFRAEKKQAQEWAAGVRRGMGLEE